MLSHPNQTTLLSVMPKKFETDEQRRKYNREYQRRRRNTQPRGKTREKLRVFIDLKYPNYQTNNAIAPLDREIIRLYLSGLTMRQVAASTDISHQRVNQRIQRILKPE